MKLWCTLQMILVKILSISQSARTFRATGSATSTSSRPFWSSSSWVESGFFFSFNESWWFILYSRFSSPSSLLLLILLPSSLSDLTRVTQSVDNLWRYHLQAQQNLFCCFKKSLLQFCWTKSVAKTFGQVVRLLFCYFFLL